MGRSRIAAPIIIGLFLLNSCWAEYRLAPRLSSPNYRTGNNAIESRYPR